VLDAAGGTDIFQMPTGRLKLTAGADALRCLRLSGKGILRWYADCCRTPIGNTVGPRVPVVGLIHSFMRGEAGGRSLSAVLGAPLCLPHLCWLGQRAAAGGRAAAGLVRALLAPRIDDSAWWWRGLARPNPFFDAQTGAPLSVPRVLTPSERAAL